MMEFEYFTSIRELVAFSNMKKLSAKDIKIIPAQGVIGYYLLYNNKPQKKDAQ